MTKLPVVDLPQRHDSTRRGMRVVVHLVRVALFVSILMMIRFAASATPFVESELETNAIAVHFVGSVFAGDVSIGEFDKGIGGNVVIDPAGKQVGYVFQTLPQSDHVIGYSGPTNCLVALGPESKIRSIAIIASGDTIDHVELVKQDQSFLDSFQGLGFETTNKWKELDGVSGATLTSYSIIASVAKRMSGSAPSLKFEAKPKRANVKRLFPAAESLVQTDSMLIWNVFDPSESRIGFVLTTTPVGDHLSGYQGPTATLAGFDLQEKCVGLVVDQTYENEPYATYLNNEYSFLNLYRGKSLENFAAMDPEALGIEGVSGATMTSRSVADALPIAARVAMFSSTQSSHSKVDRLVVTRSLISYWADLVTVILVLIGVAFSFTNLSSRKWFRIGFQVAVIVLLGFVNGHMLSQASIEGWSAYGIPWRVVPGLVFLSLAAFLIPIVSKQQPYCQHICPFGGLQQFARAKAVRKRIGWRLKIPARVSLWLEMIPWVLLALVVQAAIMRKATSFAAIEPFDAFGFRVAGWATISVFVIGLLASLVSPMAYCRFGCPTGAILNFLKFRGDSHRLGLRDLAAASLFVLALVLWF